MPVWVMCAHFAHTHDRPNDAVETALAELHTQILTKVSHVIHEFNKKNFFIENPLQIDWKLIAVERQRKNSIE